MAMSTYTKGSLVRLSAAFTVSGVATDPTTVTCTVRDPAGIETTYASPTKDSAGNYHVDHDLTSAIAGVWSYRYSGTGACQAALENTFYVAASAF